MSYTIIKSFVAPLTHRKPNCTSSNIDIFLSNVHFPQNFHTIDDLSSNHLPIVLSFKTQNNVRRQHETEQTDWNTLAKNCSRFKINQKLTTTVDIDNEIEALDRLIQRSFRNATSKTPNDQTPLQTRFFNLIKERNEHRRKFQKTGNLFHKLHRKPLKSHPQTYRRSSKSNMAGQACEHQEDEPHTLADL